MKAKKKIKKILIIIGILILIPILVVAGVFIFRNSIATSFIEKSGSTIVGAKVEVDGVNIIPTSLNIMWERLQVTDKNSTMTNLFETGSCVFKLEFKPLLAGKFIVETMQIDNLLFETKREIDGKLPPKKIREKSELQKDIEAKLMDTVQKNLLQEKEKIPVFNPSFLTKKANVDSIITILNFQTPAKADSLQKLLNERYGYWEDRLDKNNYQKDLTAIKKDSKKINIEKLDKVDELVKALPIAKSIYDRSNKLYKDVKQDKKNLNKDLKTLKKLKKDVPRWIQADYENALALAELPDVQVNKVALMLFGDKISGGLMQVLEQMKTVREVSGSKTEIQKSRKNKMPHLPKLWIKKILLTATTKDGSVLSGLVQNVTDDQAKTQQPMTIELSGEQDKFGKIDLTANFDYRNEDTLENVRLDLTGMPITKLNFTNFELLPTELKRGEGELNSEINVINGIVSADIYFEIADVEFNYVSQPKMDARLVRISRSIAEAIDKITFDANVDQTKDGFEFKVDSNLDNLIAKQMRQILSQEFDRAKRELRKKVDKELDKYMDQVNKLIAQKEKELLGEYSGLLSDVTSEKNSNDKLVDKIEEKKDDAENALKKSAKKLLKGLKF
jgi:uncharacterized protein (TIGR03545 family)